MKKILAATCVFTALFSLTGCGRQAPLLKQEADTGTYEGVLEDKNANVVVVRARDGSDRLFWMTEGVTCEADCGDRVLVTYTGDLSRDDQVPTVISVMAI